MYPSVTLCRSQEEFHRARAATATLENVRVLSETAAAAWGQEAVAAERREARGKRTRELAETLAAQKLAAAAEAEREFSDPGSRSGADRGFEPA